MSDIAKKDMTRDEFEAALKRGEYITGIQCPLCHGINIKIVEDARSNYSLEPTSNGGTILKYKVVCQNPQCEASAHIEEFWEPKKGGNTNGNSTR